MFRWCRALPILLIATGAAAQLPPSGIDFANLQEDVRGLTQKVNALSLQMEQLQPKPNFGTPAPDAASYATLIQLNAAVADLNRSIQAAVAAAQTDTLAEVNLQLKKLAQQVNAALASAGKKPAGEGTETTTFSSDYPKTGESYTVVKGDTLAIIAKKLGAKRQDIVNANKISDPSRIQLGQVLFIPESK
jgi:nucleoid-associated protein YgaU